MPQLTLFKGARQNTLFWKNVYKKVLFTYHGAILRKIEGLGFIETVVTLRQHAKKLYKSVWFSQRVLHYPLTCKCSSSITKIIDKALTFFFKAGMACLLTYLLCAKVFPTLLKYLHLQTNFLKSFSISSQILIICWS